MAWGIFLVVLLLSRSRGNKASLQKLHLMAYSARTRQSRQEALRVFNGALPPSDLLVRVEPWLNRAIAFAKGARLIEFEGGKSVKSTQRGLELLEAVTDAEASGRGESVH